MNKASIPTLELLQDTGAALPPSAILVNFNRELDDPPSRSTMYNSFEPLLQKGLITKFDVSGIDKVDGTYYQITELGNRYLDEELTDVERSRLAASE